jgi:hypothetical protein
MSEKKIYFKLSKIITEEFAVLEENFTDGNPINLDTAIEFKLDTENKKFIVTCTFSFIQNASVFIKMKVCNIFIVKRDAWTSFVKGNKLIFPKSFAIHTSMLTVGTARGILHTRTDRTRFCDYVLPTIDITKIVTQDIEFND